MSVREQIKKLKEVATGTINQEVKLKTIDTLALYKDDAIPSISEIAQGTIDEKVKKYALDTIKKIKEK